MKPAPFEYFSPVTLEKAIALLEEYGVEAKLLAGGQSLIPLMNMRLAAPEYIIDINKISELDYIREGENHLEIGALTRHQTICSSDLVRKRCALLSEAAKHIAHRQVRHRGTIGGSVAHADPASEFPTVVTALDGEIKLVSPEGERWVKAEEFFFGYLMTTIEPVEMLTSIRLPIPPVDSGFSVQEIARKENYFAIAGAVCSLVVDGDKIIKVDLGLMGVGPIPLKPRQAEELLAGKVFSDTVAEEAATLASEATEPESDLHGSEVYRREMTKVLTKRALREAFRKATGGGGR
ncbi:MAG: xanthine dehydrogenase family protein subunit M [Thermodesulfobacteriota bacterium]|nr:xanthine dehydrogenase family protein subunit M [Thermodesulfobacteriota bacterium]